MGGKCFRKARRFVAVLGILAGSLLMVVSALNIAEHGFYLSGRWNPGQLEGGYIPIFFITGVAFVLVSAIDLWINR